MTDNRFKSLKVQYFLSEYIDFWLDSIHCFREDIKESIANKPYPSVIMVCTGIDKVPDKDKEVIYDISVYS